VVFIVLTRFGSKINNIFGISAKICISSHIFGQKFFFWKINLYGTTPGAPILQSDLIGSRKIRSDFYRILQEPIRIHKIPIASYRKITGTRVTESHRIPVGLRIRPDLSNGPHNIRLWHTDRIPLSAADDIRRAHPCRISHL
jgi:hypothetical protein